MQIGPGFTALITGAGSGIGRAVALAFASKGASVSVVDFVKENGLNTLEAIKEKHSKLQLNQELPAGLFFQCDVTDYENVKSAFDEHKRVYGKLDVCINCAGIAERRVDLIADDQSLWRSVIEVNLNSVIECTRRAVQLMRDGGKPGVIVNMASAAGLVPSNFIPIYSASKAGVILFTRSLSHLHSEGIRVNVLCPEFIETPLTDAVPKEIIDRTGGFIPMEKVIEATLELIENDEHAGDCLWLSSRHGHLYVPTIPKLA